MRTASEDPNGQNYPKRGIGERKRLVEAYRRIFICREDGWNIGSADLNQAELRFTSIMANERVMLSIYATGGDIHTATAARLMGLSIEQFMALPVDEMEMARFRAKAVTRHRDWIGLLYGMVYSFSCTFTMRGNHERITPTSRKRFLKAS